ncbi:hypothetical protein R6Q59_012437 [Mikania micrantha]|uniref:Uncharacterized protein n=1 Tax=Mikania micrantha TaxID=192012 RepID=A0A5N6PB08_9ASTR|nr:hypothetical protein E3N88_10209 [Mikania micrantha]
MINDQFTTSRSCFFFFFIVISYHAILMYYEDSRSGLWWLSTNSISMWSVVHAVGIVFTVGLVVVMVRTTIVTWITVLVMLRCVGTRHRVLVVEGWKITGEVAMHLLKVLVKDRSLVAVACATFLSSIAMLWVA